MTDEHAQLRNDLRALESDLEKAIEEIDAVMGGAHAAAAAKLKALEKDMARSDKSFAGVITDTTKALDALDTASQQ